MPGRGRRWFHAITLVIGAVAFAFLVRELGWAGVRQVIVGTGAWFAVIAMIDVLSVMCDAAGVYTFVRAQAPIRYGRVLVAQISGLAINRLTPGNSMGETVKVTMLVEHVPTEAAVSSIVMFNVSTFLVAISVIVIGAPITLLLLDVSSELRTLVLVMTAILVVAATGIAVLARRGPLRAAVGLLRAVRVISADRAGAWRARVMGIDAQVRELGRPGRRRGLAFIALSRGLNAFGTFVVMHAAGVPLSPVLVLATISIGILITWISNVVPLGLGIADTSNYALYGALGATGPLGLVFTMTNRTRTVVLALIGLCVMAVGSRHAARRRSRP